jgi:hypothetical protein
MSHTDLNQPGLGPLNSTYRDTHQIMNTALGGVPHGFGYVGVHLGSGGAWLVTGRRGQETVAER